MENEYNIPMNDEWGEEVREMCNLSQGIEEKGIRKGLKQGIEQGITQQKQNTISFIKEMQKKEFIKNALRTLSPEEVSKTLDVSLEEVLRVASEKK